MPLTDSDLAAIEERANKATPGPWYAVDADDDYAMCASCVATSRDVGNLDPQTVERDEIVAITLLQHPRLAEHKSQKWDENTDFIAHARTDIPALLSYVRRLQTEASNLRHQLASAQTAANLARGITERARQERAQIASVLDMAELHKEEAVVAYEGLKAQTKRIQDERDGARRLLDLIVQKNAVMIQQWRAIIEAQVAFYESKDEMGPLYRFWEDGEIGNWDDGEWDWERTLNACRNEVDCPTVEYLSTGIVNVWPVIERYRAMRRALAAIGV